ncbi:type II secretory pathway component [Glaciecola sp. 33A]|jgi:MSHA biogenesis protein MshP|nr:type II secretory pathway component [Glaciecola sp. 33A]
MFPMSLSKSIKNTHAVQSLRYRNNRLRSAQHQHGSMIVMALFAIIVLTLLAGTLVNMISTSSNSILYEVYGVRAKNAAQVGIQELAMASFPLGTGPQQCNQVIANSATFGSIAGFQACEFSARCTTTDINFNGEDYRYYRFSSSGSCGFNGIVVSRTLSVDAMQEN